MFLKAILLIVSMVLISPASAIEMTPMVINLDPNNVSRIPTTLIHNELSHDVAFDIQVSDVVFENNDIKFVPLEKSPIWIFPPSLYLKPGQSQRVQFRWDGESIPLTDKTYQISFMEYPLQNALLKNTSDLKILLDINLIAHVDQVQLVANLNVGELSVEGDYISAQVENTGKGASRLSEYEIRVISKGRLISHFLKKQLQSQGYDVFFAPNSQKIMKIPFLSDASNVPLEDLRIELVK